VCLPYLNFLLRNNFNSKSLYRVLYRISRAIQICPRKLFSLYSRSFRSKIPFATLLSSVVMLKLQTSTMKKSKQTHVLVEKMFDWYWRMWKKKFVWLLMTFYFFNEFVIVGNRTWIYFMWYTTRSMWCWKSVWCEGK